jgi:aldehyde oxidoreductase
MAVIKAINYASGVCIYALLATPDKVRAGWEAKQRGEDRTPPKYYLGTDFGEELEMIKTNPF